MRKMPAHPDGVEDVEDAQAVLQLPLLLAPHGAEDHLAEVLDVHDAAEHDDQGLYSAKVLDAAGSDTDGMETKTAKKVYGGAALSHSRGGVLCPAIQEEETAEGCERSAGARGVATHADCPCWRGPATPISELGCCANSSAAAPLYAP